ncbi:intraflagellar transport protein 122 homolog [Copidosoma floridanum]|uniref:intraflagellar transport protein 122 homolog n=1 Tax=Copidosoma floridanum TaxID=29053 RepID=UPI0006C9B42A|nr:intraflagellar transport protein 122 homolog [Copidosoma floridanum]
MKIPKHCLMQIENWIIAIKAYPYIDPEDLLQLCNRCTTYNTLLPEISTEPGTSCSHCGSQFQYSFVMFEILPLVEFELEPGITNEEAEKFIKEPVQPIKSALEKKNQLTIFSDKTDLFLNHLEQYEILE